MVSHDDTEFIWMNIGAVISYVIAFALISQSWWSLLLIFPIAPVVYGVAEFLFWEDPDFWGPKICFVILFVGAYLGLVYIGASLLQGFLVAISVFLVGGTLGSKLSWMMP